MPLILHSYAFLSSLRPSVNNPSSMRPPETVPDTLIYPTDVTHQCKTHLPTVCHNEGSKGLESVLLGRHHNPLIFFYISGHSFSASLATSSSPCLFMNPCPSTGFSDLCSFRTLPRGMCPGSYLSSHLCANHLNTFLFTSWVSFLNSFQTCISNSPSFGAL